MVWQIGKKWSNIVVWISGKSLTIFVLPLTVKFSFPRTIQPVSITYITEKILKLDSVKFFLMSYCETRVRFYISYFYSKPFSLTGWHPLGVEGTFSMYYSSFTLNEKNATAMSQWIHSPKFRANVHSHLWIVEFELISRSEEFHFGGSYAEVFPSSNE